MRISYISKQLIPAGEEVRGKEIRKGIFEYISHPDFSEENYISLSELNTFRRKYLTALIQSEKGELKTLDLDVMYSIHNNETLSDTFQNKEEDDLTFGQRMPDKIAEFGGSWSFIISFSTFIVIWIAFNTFMLITQKFNPFPFILLNLILSCLVSIQAFIIMMSQNRQEQKDRWASAVQAGIGTHFHLWFGIPHQHHSQTVIQSYFSRIPTLNGVHKHAGN